MTNERKILIQFIKPPKKIFIKISRDGENLWCYFINTKCANYMYSYKTWLIMKSQIENKIPIWDIAQSYIPINSKVKSGNYYKIYP